MKKVKNEIKRAFRLPGNAAVMTMMAVILVCAAPALISIIDDSMNDTMGVEVDAFAERSNFKAYVAPLTGQSFPDSKDGTCVWLNDGSAYTIVISDPTVVGYVSSFSFDWFDRAVFRDAGVSRIVLSFDSDSVSSVRFLNGSDWDTFVKVVDDDGSISWVYDLSTIDRVRLSGDESLNLGLRVLFPVGSAPDVLTMEYSTTSNVIIPYGEIIIGATGALLLICAILATPWVSTSGLTVKRRR